MDRKKPTALVTLAQCSQCRRDFAFCIHLSSQVDGLACLSSRADGLYVGLGSILSFT